MSKYEAMARALVWGMTADERISLLCGAGFWRTRGVPRLGLAPVMLCDGPHGLRKQPDDFDHLGINGSLPATCFPTACATACSFDRELLRETGAAIADECREERVAVILGPGMNIKRSPLCGRNFEYFSEDPLLSGELAAAFTGGVQSRGVGVSVKHFAMNSQEKGRMVCESAVDERAAREIYLAGFERVVKTAAPWTVMCSYNRFEGEYVSESRKLLTDILRGEWGFDGLVVSDWGAVSDRVRGVKAGMDLQMPGPDGWSEKRVRAAVKSGEITGEELDLCAARVAELLLRAREREPFAYDREAHRALARRAAGESAVLLKNDGGLLPFKPGAKLAVIGAFAESPRYQGAGSSKINPNRLDNALDELLAAGVDFDYAPGYGLENDEPDEALIAAACRMAAGKDAVLIFAGLPDRYESEGFDRDSLAMPKAHTLLIERVAAANPNAAVVLCGGGVMDCFWEKSAKAVLLAGLGGEAGAGAVADIVTGRVDPSGKLAESWPLALSDCAASRWFPGTARAAEYRESVFVGYRWFDTAKLPVRWPFGHGLSYTSFEYSVPRVSETAEGYELRVTVTNTGLREGAEVVQLYVSHPMETLFTPEQELRGFTKLRLAPGESGEAVFYLTPRDFSYWNAETHGFVVDGGDYELRVAASSRDIRQSVTLSLPGDGVPAPDMRETAPCYYDIAAGLDVPDGQFAALLGHEPPAAERDTKTPHSADSTLTEIRDRPVGRLMGRVVDFVSDKMAGDDEEMRRLMRGSMADSPLRVACMGGVPRAAVEAAVKLLNASPRK